MRTWPQSAKKKPPSYQSWERQNMIEYMEAKYVNKFYKTSGILRQISNQIDYRKKLSKF